MADLSSPLVAGLEYETMPGPSSVTAYTLAKFASGSNETLALATLGTPISQIIGPFLADRNGPANPASPVCLTRGSIVPILCDGVAAINPTDPITLSTVFDGYGGKATDVSDSIGLALTNLPTGAPGVVKVLLMGSGANAPSAIIHWSTHESWSQILTKLNAVPAGSGSIVMMDAGTYTMDIAANLNQVDFIGMVESPTAFGGTPTTLNIVAPFTLLGSVLYLENIVCTVDTTILDGTGPYRFNLSGSSSFTRTGAVPAIKLGAAGVLNVSVADFGLFGGGPDYTVEMDEGSVINSLLSGAGIIGDKTAVLKGGAAAATVTMALDSTCVVAGVNGAFGSAFGAGIDSTTSVYKNGNAFFGPYQPTVLADWSGTSPADIGTALDRIAAAIGPIA